MDFHDTILVCEENLDATTTYITKQQQTLAQALADHLPTEHVLALLDLDKKGWQNIQAHGDFLRWSQGLNALPDVQAEVEIFHQVCVQSVVQTDVNQEKVTQALQQLHPWRKGPFEVFGVHIDTEWRSDWKWQRVLPHI
ncbi:MAG: DUF1698 domain-containing protein, partial [Ghiorsea sp.]|nr:DUF1698 domain-containing protein [Ghiorsea sp.]